MLPVEEAVNLESSSHCRHVGPECVVVVRIQMCFAPAASVLAPESVDAAGFAAFAVHAHTHIQGREIHKRDRSAPLRRIEFLDL